MFYYRMKLNSKIEKSTMELSKLDAAWAPAEPDADKEILTDEERECFKKIGLKMHGFLVLGEEDVTLLTASLKLYRLCSLQN